MNTASGASVLFAVFGTVFSSLVSRAKEPSTWAGIGTAAMAGAVAWQTKDPVALGAAVSGVAAVFMKEKGSVQKVFVPVDAPGASDSPAAPCRCPQCEGSQ